MIHLQQLRTIFSCIDHNKDNYISELREAVRIKSVSTNPDLRDEVNRMVFWFEDVLKKTGFKTELCDIGFQDERCGLEYPPVLLATFKGSAKKRTLLFYGHVDVYPAEKSEGWHTEPFDLTERSDKLYGRGTSNNKGPVLAWINAVNAYRDSEVELPVHIKIVLEAMEESFSEGIEELFNKKKSFLKDIDYICVSDGLWIDINKPCISYGFRGFCHFNLDVECAKRDLHSGTYGGILNEALADLIYLLGSLTDKEGKILVPGIYTDVAKLTTTEDEAMKKLAFNSTRYKEINGIKKLLFREDKVKILHHAWRFPSLSYHEIEHLDSSTNSLSCVPAKVAGRFSLRIVPNQTTKRVEKLIVDHLKKKWKERGSYNEMKIKMTKTSEPWVGDPSLPYFEAARKAMRTVYEVEPDMIRDGKSFPVAEVLCRRAKANMILLPIGAVDDATHSLNEKMDISNFIQGIKLVAAFMSEISAAPLSPVTNTGI